MHCVTKDTDPQQIVDLLNNEYLPKSRFVIWTLEVGDFPRACSWKPSLKILGVRLRRKKYYCGQHAGPCQISPFFEKKHKLASWLEGADWVAFNDMLNDLCDKYRISANIWSERESVGRLYLRQWSARCNYYGGDHQRGQHWQGNKDTLSEFTTDHFGVAEPAERSDFEEGTPGIPEWLKERESLPEYAELFAHETMTRKERRLAAAH